MARDSTNNKNDGVPGGTPPAAEAAPDDPLTGTVLDYLWMDLPDGASEPEAVEASASGQDQASPAPEEFCLQSTLARYNDWLDSQATD